MDIIDNLRAFVATAQSGSFTAAADQLGISNRLTSKYVAELETRLGTRLLQRTTRRVGLTPAGEDLLARAPALLDDLDNLLSEATESGRGFSGVVRVSASITFGEIYVGPMLGRFAEAHPDLTIDLRLTDTFVDLASDGIDVAFRIGRSDMLSLKTRRLGTMRIAAVASPGYIAARGAPQDPAELARHSCIIDSNSRTPRRWVFAQGGTERAVDVQGQFHVNSARAAVALAAQGLGIAYVPRFTFGDLAAQGKVVAVLEDFDGPSPPLSAVWLEGRTMPRKLRALIDFAAEDAKRAGLF